MATPNRVSNAHIDSILQKLEYKFSLIDGLKTTVCTAIYEDFTIGFGTSACVDPANYNQELGEKYAKERAFQNAVDNIWQCEGWRLRFNNLPFKFEQKTGD